MQFELKMKILRRRKWMRMRIIGLTCPELVMRAPEGRTGGAACQTKVVFKHQRNQTGSPLTPEPWLVVLVRMVAPPLPLVPLTPTRLRARHLVLVLWGWGLVYQESIVNYSSTLYSTKNIVVFSVFKL